MALEDDIKNIKKLNEEIETLSKKLREPTKIFEEGEINQAKLYIKSLRNELLKVNAFTTEAKIGPKWEPQMSKKDIWGSIFWRGLSWHKAI